MAADFLQAIRDGSGERHRLCPNPLVRLRNTSETYGWASIVLHWLTAAAVFALFGLGLWMRGLDYYHPWYHRAPDLHRSLGMATAALLALRLCWRMLDVNPEILGSRWERLAARTVHRLHYLLLSILVVTGYLIPTAKGRGFEIFSCIYVPSLLSLSPHRADLVGAVHRYAAWAVVILVTLHTAAALKHHFVDRDATLLRMLGFEGRRKV